MVPDTRGATLRQFVLGKVERGSTLYTDEAPSYERIPGYRHASVAHGRGQYVDGEVHTNGIESFWTYIKRAHKGTHHKMGRKHLHRYVTKHAGRNNLRGLDTSV